MGFFKKLVKAATNPTQAIKDPKQAIKNSVAMGLDPAGSFVRMGTTGNAAPVNGRQMIDPSGKLLTPEQQATPQSTYTPGAMQLSPGAQALYNDMKARMAARAAGQNYTPPATASPGYAPTPAGGVRPIMQVGAATPQVSTPLQAPAPTPQPFTPSVAAPAAAASVPARAQSYKGLSGVPMADGGKVKGDGHQRFDNKAFTRKPNGKPF